MMLLGLSTAVLADQVTLKNGDRLTGTVVKSDGKTLVLHTDAAGDVTIQFDTIQDQDRRAVACHPERREDGRQARSPPPTERLRLTKTAGTGGAQDDVTSSATTPNKQPTTSPAP
jgi:hypothetical protein